MHTQEVAYTRLSYRAQRDRQRRQEEDPPQRATRLARQRIRNRERRQGEDPGQRDIPCDYREWANAALRSSCRKVGLKRLNT